MQPYLQGEARMVGGSVHRQRVDALHEVIGPHFRAVHKSSACTQCDEWVAGGTIRRQEQSSVTSERLADQRGFAPAHENNPSLLRFFLPALAHTTRWARRPLASPLQWMRPPPPPPPPRTDDGVVTRSDHLHIRDHRTRPSRNPAMATGIRPWPRGGGVGWGLA